MSRNQKIIDIHANNLEPFLGVLGEKTRVNGAGFEIQKLQLAGFMREPFKAGLAETIECLEKRQVETGAVIVAG